MSTGHTAEPGQPFEIGLIMAGTVSAGAYTAGVLDFLFESLEAWYAAKRAGMPDCPPHEIRLKVMTGASGGGICAAIVASMLREPTWHPVQDVPNAPTSGSPNKLFESWVNRIDVRGLFGSRDLQNPSQPVRSLLDSTVLNDIATAALTVPNPQDPSRHGYLSETLHLIVTLTNLRGVPYNYDPHKQTALAMILHADHARFTLGKVDPGDRDVTPLPWDQPHHASWSALGTAALATSAFPIGLAPRPLERDRDVYERREWPFHNPVAMAMKPDEACADMTACRDLHGTPQCVHQKAVPPSWPPGMSQEYHFLSVDGGVIDNEPIALGHEVLAGREGSNPRGGEEATRALVMIDPFGGVAMPTGNEEDHTEAGLSKPSFNLLNMAVSLLGAMKDQCRFRPEELKLAMDEDVFSRFLIAPDRGNHRITDPVDGHTQYDLAGASLWAFGGFLARRFRLHDYQLGRRNCQRFLDTCFMLPEGHALFQQGWTDAAKAKYRVTDYNPDGTVRQTFLPIIPLMDGLRMEPNAVPLPIWPAPLSADELKAIRDGIHGSFFHPVATEVPGLRDRADAVVQRFIDLSGQNQARRGLMILVKWQFLDKLVDYLMNKLQADLAHRGLASPPS